MQFIQVQFLNTIFFTSITIFYVLKYTFSATLYRGHNLLMVIMLSNLE